jgi:hypothetical protein
MDLAIKTSSRAIRQTVIFGGLLKIVTIVLGNLFLGVPSPTDVTGVWLRYVPSLLADAVIGWLYVYFHMQRLSETSLRPDIGAKGGFVSSLAIHAVTGALAIFFGLCGTILNIGDPTHQEGLTSVAVGLSNLWFSEYRIVLTSRGTIVLIGAMLSAISGILCVPLMARGK